MSEDRIRELEQQLDAAERGLGSIKLPPLGDVGPTVAGFVGQFGGPVLEIPLTAGGYMYEQAIAGRPIDPIEAGGLASRDYATGLGMGVVGRQLAKSPAGKHIINEYAKPAADFASKQLRDFGELVAPEPVNMGGAYRRLVRDPRGVSKNERQAFVKTVEGDFQKVGGELSSADIGDPLAQWLEGQTANHPFSKSYQKTFDRWAKNEQALSDVRIAEWPDDYNAGGFIRDRINSAEKMIRELDADVFESASSGDWDSVPGRIGAASVMAENADKIGALEYMDVPADRGHLSKETRKMWNEYSALISEYSGETPSPSTIPAPRELNSFRMRIFDEYQKALTDNREVNASILRRMYDSVVDAQAQFLPKDLQADWAIARKRWAQYEEFRPYINRLTSENARLDKIVSNIANNPQALDAVDWFVSVLPGNAKKEVLDTLAGARLGGIVSTVGSFNGFAAALNRLPVQFRERINPSILMRAAGIAELGDIVKASSRAGLRAGGGQGRLSFDSIWKWAAFGRVTDELAQEYAKLPKGYAEKLGVAGMKTVGSIVGKLARKHLRQSVTDPYIYEPGAEKVDEYIQNRAYATPDATTTGGLTELPNL